MPSTKKKTNPAKETPVVDSGYYAGYLSSFAKFPLQGEITQKSIRCLISHILTYLMGASLADRKKPILLLIDSGGGCMGAAWKMVDFIATLCDVPVDGLVVGSADSAASLILQACRNRMATPNATMLVHAIRSTKTVYGDPTRIRRAFANYQENQVALAARTKRAFTARGVPPKQYDRWFERGEYDILSMHADDMLQHRFIDRVVKRAPLFEPYDPPTK